MWNRLRQSYGLSVCRDTVMNIMRDIDPDGCEARKRRKLQRRKFVSSGPNKSWHMDGYDKIKPYGFPIHGCVDGFSRRVMWLKVTRRNNNPVVPASYFIEAIATFQKCPQFLQTDCGTENGLAAGIQCAILNDIRAHRYGSSPSNQRIENWWSHFKRGYSSWIIDFFKQLVHDGKFILGNVFHMECAWFSFSHLIQRELDKTRHEWNTHFIRKSRHDTISGIPDELYFLPERKQYRDEGFAVSYAEINNILLHRDVVSESIAIQNVADNDLEQYFYYVVQVEQLKFPPTDWEKAKTVFLKIIESSGL